MNELDIEIENIKLNIEISKCCIKRVEIEKTKLINEKLTKIMN